MLIQLVASERGVAALPDGVVQDYEKRGWVISRRLPVGPEGLRRTLYAGYRIADQQQAYLDGFLALMVQMNRQNRPTRYYSV
jgi:LysR family transcriptional regulator for metE and metH